MSLFYTNAANREVQKVARTGQYAERFGNAIDQLGSDRLGVRQGAIYSLSQLMDESEALEDDIIAVLTAYVRDPAHAGYTPTQPEIGGSVHIAVDVQAALTAIGERPHPQRHANIDLTSSNLHLADLSGLDLTNADFSYSDVTMADFTETNLQNSDFFGAILEHANFGGADLRGANLFGNLFSVDTAR